MSPKEYAELLDYIYEKSKLYKNIVNISSKYNPEYNIIYHIEISYTTGNFLAKTKDGAYYNEEVETKIFTLDNCTFKNIVNWIIMGR